ncbi:hypothetical protein CBS147308_9070 [Penicillium roqueforti]|nr:hypothetical protein CBS147308_9070 [Penicillium roqueforti]
MLPISLALSVPSERSQRLLMFIPLALAPHRRVDVKALNVGFYALSWYKVRIPVIGEPSASKELRMPVDGVVRVSILHYNTEAELTPYMRFNLKTDFEKSHSLTSPDSRLLLCLAASTTALYRQATSVVLPVHGPLGALI